MQKIVVRNPVSKLYRCVDNSWASKVEEAQDFRTVGAAYEFCHASDLSDFEVVKVTSDDPVMGLIVVQRTGAFPQAVFFPQTV